MVSITTELSNVISMNNKDFLRNIVTLPTLIFDANIGNAT